MGTTIVFKKDLRLECRATLASDLQAIVWIVHRRFFGYWLSYVNDAKPNKSLTQM